MVKSKQADHPESFEQAVAELESIVAAMERDDLPLEQALASYQRGIALLRQCQGTLSAAEQKIRILEDGKLADLPTTGDSQ
ncbi:MAG: xseB [Proteobacteria bacterium]|nr:xseB [Pseudomonadota bacterium]